MKNLSQQNLRYTAEVLHHLIGAPDHLDIDANDIEEMIFAYMNQKDYLTDGTTDSDRIKAMVDEVNRIDVTIDHCQTAVRNWVEFESAKVAEYFDVQQSQEYQAMLSKEIGG